MEVLLYLILQAARLYSFLILAWVLMSWFPNARESSIGQMIGRLVEPYIDMFRQFVPRLGMIDLSPIVSLLVLNMATNGLRFLFVTYLL
ncbi:YggT family protein [Alkalicoccobacillus murimartini]|uniref:YggT family protein n=1 Tax=Alkalicoccobacillus murimartini TaxID=171685 RepID=A0ABT9YF30_9BACI|nr:YggT family protein [Alkalicoccobacillus murimartini]MDQ0206432.1 YggT family protein [Alkalicoccobacillus murimartini]